MGSLANRREKETVIKPHTFRRPSMLLLHTRNARDHEELKNEWIFFVQQLANYTHYRLVQDCKKENQELGNRTTP